MGVRGGFFEGLWGGASPERATPARALRPLHLEGPAVPRSQTIEAGTTYTYTKSGNTDDGRPYYYNKGAKETKWNLADKDLERALNLNQCNGRVWLQQKNKGHAFCV